MKLCPVCKKNKSIEHSVYGTLPCMSCSERQKGYAKPQRQVEFTTSEIKDQRKQYADDIVQPFNKGIFSKEYYDKHGTKGIQVTDQEIKNAKEVWKDEKYYS